MLPLRTFWGQGSCGDHASFGSLIRNLCLAGVEALCRLGTLSGYTPYLLQESTGDDGPRWEQLRMCSALSNLLLTLSLIVVAGLRPIAARAGSSALGRDDSDT